MNKRIMGSLTLHLIKIISEEFAKYRLIPYLCCQKEESADRKGKLSWGLQSFRVYEPPQSFLFSCKVQIECQWHKSLFRVQD